MKRQSLNQLGEGTQISEVYQLIDKQLRPNRQGNLYLQVRLSDRTGWVTGMLWNATENQYQSLPMSGYVHVVGASQIYNGMVQLIIKSMEVVDAKQLDLRDFAVEPKTDVVKLRQDLTVMLGSIRDPAIKALADCFLADETLMKKFLMAPAGIKNHHAYHGGLIEHVVNLMRVCQAIVPFYPTVDADLLLIGAFLHDLGKIDELSYDGELGYSDAGQLLGHVLMILEILTQKLREAERRLGKPVPVETQLRIKHMIASHHGEYEFGSPRLPMTPEAMALHLLDNLDAKLHGFKQLVEEDLNTQSSWTTYQPSLNRKIFKGGLDKS
jgi:3'-5' exoribonuclease